MVEKEDQDSETGDIAGRGMGAPSTGSLEQPSFESEVMSKVGGGCIDGIRGYNFPETV